MKSTSPAPAALDHPGRIEIRDLNHNLVLSRIQELLPTMYDLMLEANAAAMLMLPMFNYSDGNHDAIREIDGLGRVTCRGLERDPRLEDAREIDAQAEECEHQRQDDGELGHGLTAAPGPAAADVGRGRVRADSDALARRCDHATERMRT